MKVFIPEYDARILLEGLRFQAKAYDYSDSWRACVHRLADQIELEQTQQADPTDAPELEYLGEVQPGKSYLLRATEPLQPQDGMRVREQLERTFPGSTFAILRHNLEPVEPKPAADLLTVLRDTALKYQELATKMEPGPSRAACSIVSNALLDVWHALMTAQTGVPE